MQTVLHQKDRKGNWFLIGNLEVGYIGLIDYIRDKINEPHSSKMAPARIPDHEIQGIPQRNSDCVNYDHVTWWVSNAKQTASYFCNLFGFHEIGYKGLETGSRDICSHAIQTGKLIMIFVCAIRGEASEEQNTEQVNAIHNWVRLHGDSVKDVAFTVTDADATYETAVAAGAKPVSPPYSQTDKFGSIRCATIQTYGDVTHTLVDRAEYRGVLLPGYRLISQEQTLLDSLVGESKLEEMDHCVGNEGWDEMDAVCRFYEQALGFHRFWSVDDKMMRTEYSALSSTVMANRNEKIKMPINQPASGLKKSQVVEFLDFNGGPGVQHIALKTHNIIETVRNLRARGVEFITVPSSYYTHALPEKLEHYDMRIKEDLKVLEQLGILVDCDNKGYLLQLFTRPVTDRPTIFFEIIQRNNFDGFGAGNFKSLFEAIEREQAVRGTL